MVAELKDCIQLQTPAAVNDRRIQAILEAVLDDRGIHAPTTAAVPPIPVLDVANTQQPHVHAWGGGEFRCVPPLFEFPRGTLVTAWQYWCVGDPVKNYPPFRQLTNKDMASANNKKRLSDLRLVMGMVEECLRSHQVEYTNISADQAARFFQIARPLLPIAERAHGGDRDEQLEWVSLVRYAPRKRRRQRRVGHGNRATAA